MYFISKLMKVVRYPRIGLLMLLNKASFLIPDKLYLQWMYRLHIRKKLDLNHPVTFNEKLQWLKLYNRCPEYIRLVDKVEAKKYVAEKIGEEYIIPTLGVWNDPDEIDFDNLPDQFVLKCNHNSGLGMCICKDKSKLDIKKVKAELRRGLNQNYFLYGREWPYKDVPRKILAEKFMVDETGDGDLEDYKLMCFDGKVYCTFVCSERYDKNGLKVTFFDINWKRLPFERCYPSSEKTVSIPKNYHKMIRFAEALSQEIPFIRTDFYEINGKLYFGELTFYPGSGWERFTPDEWDKRLGELIKLPSPTL